MIDVADCLPTNKQAKEIYNMVKRYLESNPKATEVALFPGDWDYLTRVFETTDLKFKGIPLRSA